MENPIYGFVKSIFKPAAELIDNLHTSGDEKGQIQIALEKIEAGASNKLLELRSQVIQLEGKVLAAKQAVIVAEANSGSWITQSWRPITMLVFVFLIVMNQFGWLENELPKEAWEVLKIGIGGYVGGRSLEKVTLPIVQYLKDKKSNGL